jgi:predicted AlkP superfamily pyrophosphatase or phosphodiesterase
MPSVTLPCHMSLFHSVTPQRHGIATNIYTPQVRPIKGLGEQLRAANKKAAICFSWEELRDLTRPGSLDYSYFLDLHRAPQGTDAEVGEEALRYLLAEQPDFLFYYIAMVDETGHRYGWMSPEYMEVMRNSLSYVEKIYRALPEGYTLLVTADHGGHDRTHGTEATEDMTIPLFCVGPQFVPGSTLPEGTTILDIAPTIVDLVGAFPAPEWEGKSLLPEA